MKRIFLIPFLLFAATLTTYAQEPQVVFHDKDAELRNVEDFHAIDVSSAIDLQLSQGSENSVAVSAEGDQNKANIKTVVKNGVLKIWYEQKHWRWGGGRKIRVYVAAKNLDRVTASGACDVRVNGVLSCIELLVGLSGASDFKGQVNAGSLKFDLSGASDVVVSGKAGNLSIGASGASHFKGYDLVADNCRIDASGASDIKITVNKVLNAEASGATNIDYKGTGMIGDIRTSGASNIRKRS
jgi:hypothetical protein